MQLITAFDTRSPHTVYSRRRETDKVGPLSISNEPIFFFALCNVEGRLKVSVILTPTKVTCFCLRSKAPKRVNTDSFSTPAFGAIYCWFKSRNDWVRFTVDKLVNFIALHIFFLFINFVILVELWSDQFGKTDWNFRLGCCSGRFIFLFVSRVRISRTQRVLKCENWVFD